MACVYNTVYVRHSRDKHNLKINGEYKRKKSHPLTQHTAQQLQGIFSFEKRMRARKKIKMRYKRAREEEKRRERRTESMKKQEKRKKKIM